MTDSDIPELNGEREIIYYDNLDAMQMALEAGDIDSMNLPKSTADYLVANNDKMEMPEGTMVTDPYYVDKFVLVTLKNKTDESVLKNWSYKGTAWVPSPKNRIKSPIYIEMDAGERKSSTYVRFHFCHNS